MSRFAIALGSLLALAPLAIAQQAQPSQYGQSAYGQSAYGQAQAGQNQPTTTQPTATQPSSTQGSQYGQRTQVTLPQQNPNPGVAAQLQPNQVPQQQLVSSQPSTAPFTIDPSEKAWIDQVLRMWERDSKTVKTFYCEFERDVYNQFGPPGYPMNRERGKLGYINPDQGSIEITDVRTWTPEPQAPPEPGAANPTGPQPMRGDWKAHEGTVGDHWVCDGKFFYEHRHNVKQLVVTPIPPDMQGQNIVDGPLPFLFGAEADKLNERYWFRVARELCDKDFTRIGIHAVPKTQVDRANFVEVYVILRHESGKPLMPMAMRLRHPDGSHDDYRFNLAEARVNAPLDRMFKGMFLAPRTPRGWTRVEEPVQQAQQLPQTEQGLPRQ